MQCNSCHRVSTFNSMPKTFAVNCGYCGARNDIGCENSRSGGITDNLTAASEGNLSALGVQIGGQHYKGKAIQPIEYCMANNLNACESSIVKYITRWSDKGGVLDLEKIKHYVDLLIQLDPRAKSK